MKLSKPYLKQKSIYFVLAACAVMILLIVPLAFYTARPAIKLEHSTPGIKVSYVNKAPGINTSYDLVNLTEDQILQEYSSAVFMGTVQDIQNIVISFGFVSKEYRAIATVKVDETYKGDPKPGDLVQILLPCPIDKGIWVEDTEVASAIRTGMKGIFMPQKYDDTSIWSQDGETLYLEDICEYGFPDGARFAFLETEQGILYADWAFEISPKPVTLEDVKNYLAFKLNGK